MLRVRSSFGRKIGRRFLWSCFAGLSSDTTPSLLRCGGKAIRVALVIVVVIEYCRQRSLHFSAYAGIKRPSFEVADNSSRNNMQGIPMGGATKDPRHTAAAVGDCSSPLDSLLKFPLFLRLDKSRQQTAISHLNIDIPESQKKLSGEVLR